MAKKHPTRFWEYGSFDTEKPDLTIALVRAMASLPRAKARDMARLVLLATQYLEDGLEPPMGLVEPDGEES